MHRRGPAARPDDFYQAVGAIALGFAAGPQLSEYPVGSGFPPFSWVVFCIKAVPIICNLDLL